MGSLFGKKRRQSQPSPAKPVIKVQNKELLNNPKTVRTVKALYDYEGVVGDNLDFKAGDRLKVLRFSEDGWWFAERVDDGKTGYIPSNYVSEDNQETEAQEWWFEYDRRSANVQLKHFQNDVGAFMVRHTEDGSMYALSVLTSRNIQEKSVKHFKIRQSDGLYYLVKRLPFEKVTDLVDHYKKNPLPGDCPCLGRPCTREIRSLPFRSLEVNRDDIEIFDKVGGGMFGDVMLGRFMRRHEVAVKRLKENSIMKKEDFEKEAKIMHALRHPRIVQLMGICMREEPYYIITEYMSYGSLLTYLKDELDPFEAEQHLIDICAQIADGMSYLEIQDPPYLHRDLRAANCLVNENRIAKVADFGLAKMLDEGIYEGGETCKFPVKWTAPEGLERKVFSVKSDVWSYGILLYEIFSLGKPPYYGWDHMCIRKEVLDGFQLKIPKYASRYEVKVSCPKEVQEKGLQCLNMNPNRRPSFVDLKKFFGNFYSGTDSYQRVEDR